jgi:hypothetical protein
MRTMDRMDTRMTRVERIPADFSCNSVEIRCICVIRVSMIQVEG